MKRDKNVAPLASEFFGDPDAVPAGFQESRPAVGRNAISLAGASRSRGDDQDSSHSRRLPSLTNRQKNLWLVNSSEEYPVVLLRADW